MTAPALLAIHLEPSPPDLNALAPDPRDWVQQQLAAGHTVTILASQATAAHYRELPVTIWPDGAPRGILRLLALVRRISWGQFAAIYDFDSSRRTRTYRWFIRPCPPWHPMAPRVSWGTEDPS